MTPRKRLTATGSIANNHRVVRQAVIRETDYSRPISLTLLAEVSGCEPGPVKALFAHLFWLGKHIEDVQ